MESLIKRNYQNDVVVNKVTGNANLVYSALIQYLFNGISSDDYVKYYIEWGARILQPYSTNGVYVCIDSESTGFDHVVFRVVSASGSVYEGNKTFTLIDISSSGTAGQTFQLIRRAGM